MIYFDIVVNEKYLDEAEDRIICSVSSFPNADDVLQVWTDELKQELTPGWWAQLLALYCNKGDLESAKQCLNQIKTQELFELDASKIVKLSKLYIENNQFDGKCNNNNSLLIIFFGTI